MALKEQKSTNGDNVLLSVGYNGRKARASILLYNNGEIETWFDDSGHLPYLISSDQVEELEKNRNLTNHSGFDHVEPVMKKDLIKDKEIKMSKVIAKDPLSIGGGNNSIRDLLLGTWEDKIRYHNCYIYDKGLIPGFPYKVISENDPEYDKHKNGIDVYRNVKGKQKERGKLIRLNTPVPNEIRLELLSKFKNEPEEFQRELPKFIDLFFTDIPQLKRIAFDIEVESDRDRLPDPNQAEDRVFCVSLVANDGLKRVLVLKREGIPDGEKKENLDINVEFFDKEEVLLKHLLKQISKYPIVLTFNGDNFDFKYIYNRAKNLDIYDLRKKYPNNWEYERAFRYKIPIELAREEAILNNGVHVDLYKFFHNRAIQISAFQNSYANVSLEDVSQALLNTGKIELEHAIYNLSNYDVAYYCYMDSKLTLQLTEFDDELVMNLIILMMRISKLSMNTLTRVGILNWLQNSFYFEHRGRDYLIPNADYVLNEKGLGESKAIIKGKKFQGAIVIQPTPGIFFDVVVLDFASLYPSIIKQYNLSYETINCIHKDCQANEMPGTNYYVCTKNIGLMSLIIGLLKDLRVKWFKPKTKDKNLSEKQRRIFDVTQYALKVIVNASYGVFGAQMFPLYCPPMAESVTAGGRYAIQQTIKRSEDLGVKVLYGDTDSVFLLHPSKDQIKELINWVKNELKIDLEVEKTYRYTALSDRKKNYFGVYKDGRVDVKGLSGKKSNTPLFIQRAFYKMLEILSEVKKEEDFETAKDKITKLIKHVLKKLKARRYTLEELAFRTALTKKLEDYRKTTPQHVKAARLLEENFPNRKIIPGDFISYIKTRDEVGVKPIETASVNDIDYNTYKKAIESIFEQVLDALGIDFNELTGKRTLDHFI
ncbi:MAG: DNA-directed DNA polymerase I [Candidatus Lokiarchaeota archaeon]|nr:DNA-directed DNA polymerase I [Candidatus Lokiarchaeota archaeon]